MSSQVGSVWAGFARLGGRFNVTRDEIGRGIAILGRGSNELATTFAYACNESGMRTLILDMDGKVSDSLSGYIGTYDVPYFVYDTIRIEENVGMHAQLAASAYSCALDLSFEQEAVLNSLIQTIANERGVASPSSLADLIQTPDVIKSRPTDKLRTRLESLRSLNLIGEADVVKKIIEKSAIMNFRDAGSPDASETAAALLLAKLLVLMEIPDASSPDVLIFTHANRLFRSRPIFRRGQRLLNTFTSSPIPKILASDVTYGLDEDYLETCSIKVVSSTVWNESTKGLILTPNMFMAKNHPYGYDEAFIPRSFEPKKGERKTRSIEERENPELTRLIVEDVANYEAPTRASVLDYLSAGYPRDLVEKTVDHLIAQGYLTVASKKVGSGPPILVLSLTEKGRTLLERMT